MRWGLLVSAVFLIAALAVPAAYTREQRDGHQLAAHCVAMLKDYLGPGVIVEAISTISRRAADEQRAFDIARSSPIPYSMRSEMEYFAPLVYIEYRSGDVAMKDDAACTYEGYVTRGADLERVAASELLARAHIMSGRVYKIPPARVEVTLGGVKDYVLTPWRHLSYRADTR